MRAAGRQRLAVLVGGMVGTGLRAAVSNLVAVPPSAWPTATLVVNLTGALALGYLLGRWERAGRAGATTIGFLGAGVLGSYTTFSAFALETVVLADRSALLAGGYVTVSLAGGLTAALVGRHAAVLLPSRAA